MPLAAVSPAASPGLFPAVLNLATMADIHANATCGSQGPEMFCKLVEHVPGQPARNRPQCRVCNQKSIKPLEQHPIEYAIDGTNRWWQSPSIKNGMEYHHVTVTLDLKQVFQIAYVIIKAANSPRPGNWVLERSLDGVTYDPWQYYAITDTECLTRFNLNPRTGPPYYTRDDEVICTSFYSKIQPLENGEIHTSLINGRPSAEDPSPTLLNFTSARFIRLVFQRIRTLNADLMTLALNDPRDVDPIVTRRYYYSIKDISVGGMCICYGHAKACPLNERTKKFSCECEHNTCGESCDRCCPGYQQQPWMAGTFLTRHVCEKCNCHGQADDCYFNQTVADLTLSLDATGQRRGGGVCVGCRHNTAGVNCENCSAGYYRPQGVSLEDPEPCRPCLCHPDGSTSQSCVSDESQSSDWSPQDHYHCGVCLCLSRCAYGYKGFPSCERCACSIEGSTNNDPCRTPCYCKENVEGENCDRCKLGFYNLRRDNRRGCEKCSCMGVASQCSASPLAYQNVRSHVHEPTQCHRYRSLRGLERVRTTLHRDLFFTPPPYSPQGAGIKMIDGKYGQPVYPSSPSTNHVALLPENFLVSESRQPISRREFLSVLADVTSVSVRASYSTEPSATSDLHARGEKRASAVEICACPPGYAGSSCEGCVAGFRRVNGALYGGVCEACRCHGHSAHCHQVTGQCLDCSHRTAGPYCGACLPGYYGNATHGSADDCQPCACPLSLPSNNFSPTCHLSNAGELLCDRCQTGYTGPRCGRCANGYFGHPSRPGGSCQPCQCHDNLDFALPRSCDPITGQCLRCRQGYGGETCESCSDGYYGDAVNAKNCQPCQCHTNGSLSEACHQETGQCQCREHVLGRQCDECMVGTTHGLASGGSCVPCHCNSFGSKSFDCDEAGQCRCQPGVAGPKCDRCSRGFFLFQEGGCTPCDCSHVGNNCDTNTGQCICPPHTIGERCDRCAPNHWGHDIMEGCKECGCSVVGSVAQQCNMNTGCCLCRDAYRGEKCNECQLGYRDFPQCTACECSAAGSESETCDQERGVCACADRTGKCSCKANVEGHGCEDCKPGTFGLSVRNPLGCSSCYCYGLSQTCSEKQGLIRMSLMLKPEQTVLPLVDKSNSAETRTGVSFQHPEILVHADLVSSALSEPYYWRLPEQFKAYGGQLKYAVYYEAREETGSSSYEPQVIIRGGPNKDLLMMRHTAGLQIGQLTRHEIEMTEAEWKHADGRSMTREDFMDVLFYVDYILIKASQGNQMRHSRISEISLTVAEGGRPNTESERAHQIESCECPAGYSGLSCEECAAGFYRLRGAAVGPASGPASQEPGVAGMGRCVRCQCSGHSTTCDPETSICQNCQDNTEGARCESCAPGYYGVVRGFHDDCKPCACPLTNPENNFSPSCVSESFDDYRCTDCPEGYEGKYCERCATGYHGNPRMPGGRCEECKCSAWGALPGPCDPETGQCRCRGGATGPSCDQCMERHVMHECVFSCDDDCAGLLISDMDSLYGVITSVNLTTPLPPPYKILYRFENMTEELKHMLSPQRAPERLLQLADSNLGSVVTEMDQLHNRVRHTHTHTHTHTLPQSDISCNTLDYFSEVLLHRQTVAWFMCPPPPPPPTPPIQVTGKLSDHGGKLEEAQELLDAAQSKSREAGALAAQNQANLTALEVRLCCVHTVSARACEDTRLHTYTHRHTRIHTQLGPLHDRLETKVAHLTDGLSDGDLADHVGLAEGHAQQLNESAAILDGILAEAKNLSFNATAAFKAYSNIKNSVDEAEREAKAAKQSAAEALMLASGPDIPIKDEAKDSLQKSYRLLNQLSVSLSMYTAAKLAASKVVAADANATAIDVLERLGDLNLRLRGLQKNYSELEDTVRAANHMIQDPEKNIHAAGAKVKDLEDEADRLLEKLQPIKRLQDNLRRNISQIKELINQARKQANSIKVSVSSGGDCLRSYRPDIRKGRYNTIVLHVKTTTPDNLLFYLGSAKYVDFLALEMRKGKVSFLWDVGSGVGRVEYPHLSISDGKWHRIEASRNGLNGTISVYPLEGALAGLLPMPASANSPTAFTILDVDHNAYLFVGGILGTVKKADAVRTTTFTGCMGETFLDSKPIGLWNYRDRQGDCKGCTVSPQASEGEGTVQLDGEGYSGVGRPVRWNPNVSTVTFKFRTFSSDALLMYLATDDMKDFMTLELSEGKIKVTFDLGSGMATATSASRHNDGRWKSLTMTRNKKKATVSIVDIDSSREEEMASSSPGAATGLNLKEKQKIYFGGLPTQGNYSMKSRSEVTTHRYAGCLRDIEISRTPYNLLGSLDYTGVTKGCSVENIYTVSFSKPGYMELSGLSLAVATEISLSFSTQTDTGTIFLASAGLFSPKRKRRQSGEPYLSVMLNKGSLEVLVFTGSHNTRRVVRRADQGVLHDGREHALRIERLAGRSFAVQVDEEPKREAALPNDQPISLRRVFLGGIPAAVELSSNRANVPFQGCIWNLMVNNVLSDFSQPASFENAHIGRCPRLAPAPPQTPLLPPEVEGTPGPQTAPATPSPGPPVDSCGPGAAPAALEKAYQFGLTKNSHMTFAFDDTKVRERLIMEFELRTTEDSGLVLYMARINHADFVTIQVREGQVCLGYDLGHGNTSGCIPFSVNDGNWHKVRRASWYSLCGGVVCLTLPPPLQADLLDVVGLLYVGGLPQNYTSKRIGPILYSINGCIRNFKMVGGPINFNLDMASPNSTHMVGRCFVATETGTYFDGTGYLKAVSTYRVGLDVSVALEFRTSRTNGVLLAISNQGNDGLGLEISQGKVLFHVDNGAGRITAEHADPGGAGLCDGQWHAVVAHKLRHRLELEVDGWKSQAESPHTRSNTCDTNDPVYVGGYPSGVRQAALSTSTSFRGCMRNLRITKASRTMEVHFNKALEIRGVQPLSCPAVAA
uniref:Basement membrane-specific heparan sulfate proteoglycan core protein n=1 Tax=Gadus morhua TaxID=8049 RepID=A0A8C5AZY2_GADMO